MNSNTYWFINQYASTPDTGMGGRQYYLGEALANKGHKVYVVAASYSHLLRTPPEFDDSHSIQEVLPGLIYVWIKTPPYDHAHQIQRIFNWIYFAWRILSLPQILADRPKAILFSSPSLLPWLTAWLVAKRIKVKLVWDVRDLWPLTFIYAAGMSAINPLVFAHQIVENLACKKSDYIVSNLPNAMDYLVSHGANPKNFSWIPNGFSETEFGFNDRSSSKDFQHTRTGIFSVGYLGTLGEINSIHTLLEAACITKEIPAIQYILVGNGKLESKVDDFISQHKLTNVIRIKGISKRDVAKMLASFDICYVGLKNIPLYKYGFSMNKLPEYFVSERPIVLGVNSRFSPVDDAKAGFTIPPEDPEALVDAVLKLYEMPKFELKRLGKNGSEYARKYLEYKKLADKLDQVLSL